MCKLLRLRTQKSILLLILLPFLLSFLLPILLLLLLQQPTTVANKNISVVAYHTSISKSQEAYCLAAIGIRMIVCHDRASQLQADMHPCICKL